MINQIKKLLKSNSLIYQSYAILRQLIAAFASIKINTHSLQEFNVRRKGGQDLGEGNYRFYKNFLSSVNPNKLLHIIDIGANDGWFAKVIFRFAPNSIVTSYEPLKSQFSNLNKLKEKYPNYRFFGKAVGARPGSLPITEYGTSGLSSLKNFNAAYNYSEHYSLSLIDNYSVDVVTLDDEINLILQGETNIELVLKVDTQGFEYEVLKGAENSIKAGIFKWVIIELMTVEKYESAHLYTDIMSILHTNGYSIWDIYPSYYEPDTLRLTEFDAIFFLDKLSNK